ncbi:hypothetical protein BJ944DRAFT_239195 [Cunninghamella echinulata]|nr:hypothetical protein BJ944DRAFT_239195 [Cunninghamella echinulata]
MSVYRQSKRPPHVVFLVDIQPLVHLKHVDTHSLENIQTLILRILLYYVESVDDRITWGYRFFNSLSTSITMSNRRFHPVSTTSLKDFVNELYLKVTHERSKLHKTKILPAELPHNPIENEDREDQGQEEEEIKIQNNITLTKEMDPCFVNLKQALMQTLAEFQWKDIDLLGASPRSQRIRNSTIKGGSRRNEPLLINNYLYVISHRPKSFTDLNHYIYGQHEKPPNQKHDELLGIFDRIDYMASELKRWLWEDFANQHISINWMDCNDNDTSDATSNYIQKGLNSVMQMFGGCLIPETMLKIDYSHYGLSFATLFEHYRYQYMDSNPTLNLSKPTKKRSSSSSSDIENLDVPIWAGDILFNDDINGNLSVCISPLESGNKAMIHNGSNRQCSSTIVSSLENIFKNVESLNVLTFISTYEIKLDWLSKKTNGSSVTTCLVWSYNENFLTLLKLLQLHQLIIVLKLSYKPDIDTVEHKQLALVEYMMDGCAAMTLIQDDHSINFNHFTNQAKNLIENSQDNNQKPFGSDIVDFISMEPSNCIKLCDITNENNANNNDENNIQINLDMDCPPCVKLFFDENLSNPLSIEYVQKSNVESKSNLNTNQGSSNNNSLFNSTPSKKLPNSIDEFTQAIQDLYLDTLYTTKYTLLESMTTLLSYVNHILKPNNQCNIKPSTISSSLQSIIMLSSEFDEKHRKRIPSMLNLDPNESSEQEHICLATWLFNIRSSGKGNDDYEDLYLKALKIRDAKLQVIFLLTTIQIINQQDGNKGKSPFRKKKKHGYQTAQTDFASENPEEQLEIYFDRMFIWEQVSNVVPFLQERDTEAAEKSLKRLDQADIYIHTFCNQLAKSFSKKLPEIVSKLMEKIDKDDSDGDIDDVFPTTNKRRKTLLEMRIRGDSGETVQADWVNNSINSSQESQKDNPPEVTTPITGASRRKETMFPILPFMKREINMAKTLNTKSKQTTTATTTDNNNGSEKKSNKSTTEKPKFTSRPLVRRAGSFTKSALSPKRIAKRNSNTETNTFVLRKRAPDSPTTPRTRLAREFGISLTPRKKQLSSHKNVLSLEPEPEPESLESGSLPLEPEPLPASSRDLTSALLAAKAPSNDTFTADPSISRKFSSLFDDE